jgi:hypothetical protein
MGLEEGVGLMASAKEFIERVGAVAGVEGSILLTSEGKLLGHSLTNPDRFSALMLVGQKSIDNIMTNIGVDYCRYYSFYQDDGHHFHIFPIGKFFFGVLQQPQSDENRLIEQLLKLVSKVASA